MLTQPGWAQELLWIISGKLNDANLSHPPAGRRKETWPTCGAPYIHLHREETGREELWADWVNSTSLLCAMWAKHIVSLIPLNSNNPIAYVSIAAQLVNVELGLESDFKLGVHKQYAILILSHQSYWPRAEWPLIKYCLVQNYVIFPSQGQP